MSEITCSTMSVYKDVNIEIAGAKIPATIEGDISFTYTEYPAQGMGGRMEDAVDSDEEVELDDVELTVTLRPEGAESIDFKTTCTDFYEEHFGELDCEDVIGYT
tara:strand:- start:4357 stop:4668 length:312 start_codon:yes stop_codon:yes gene_type:complete